MSFEYPSGRLEMKPCNPTHQTETGARNVYAEVQVLCALCVRTCLADTKRKAEVSPTFVM